MDIQFVPNSKCNDSLFIDGFKLRYHSRSTNKQKKTVVRWRCVESKCSVTASTVDKSLVEVNGKHNHNINSVQLPIQKYKSSVKSLIFASPTKSFHLHINEALNKVDNKDEEVVFPPLESLKSSLHRVESKMIPKSPNSFDKIDLTKLEFSLNNELLIQKKRIQKRSCA